VLVIRGVGGILVALLMDQPVFGQNVLRLMVIAPFFVIPTVSALVWKNLLMNPDSGLFAWIARWLGFDSTVWFTNYLMLSVIIMLPWGMKARRHGCEGPLARTTTRMFRCS
jgi:sorbitol/mannitol transport system permease protein